MNAALPRFLKSAYRKEPLPAFLITIGVVDAVIGGFGDRWSLFTIGLGTVGVAIALRWWMISQKRQPEAPQPLAQHYLPYHSSNSELPPLSAPKQRRRRE
ncbi:hypothetical protein H6G17_21715 [Chroococcidiopsis sp. FACHB-1243]|uniref:hypothetical protein n=1 Tax=Chroococcidiopsis sp. [FACHB-1243] TaxID=2692781 RepID=UPI001782BC1A|nr:hypothetical protein [Chroococcidiopsis sp. [FACHB-1243]]MBD2308093.1 hypothetical protein [Chroococcidiopsis sp. [FACHB-1243]]